MSAPPLERAAAVLAGDVRTAARLMRDLDDARPGAEETLELLHPHTGRADVVGITGHAGAGKSTLTDLLITAWRAQGRTVGVVAVDPSSPFTGGAILGDRVRMQHHSADRGVFIRSLATRGLMGGLSRSTRAVVDVLDAMGFDRILLETVGVGQDEVEVAQTAHTSVVLLVPGLGDGVQALKAGLLEAADLFVVNKADRPEADRLVRELSLLLELEGGARGGFDVPILQTVATEGRGISAVVDSVEAHLAHLRATGRWQDRLRARRRADLEGRVFHALRLRAEAAVQREGGLETVLDEVMAGVRGPKAVIDGLLSRL